MSKKKIVTMVVAGLSVLALYLSLPVMAEGNYEDTNYYFLFKEEEPVFTEARKKEDTTSSYIKCTYCGSPGYFVASVYGMESKEPRYGRYDCSGGHTYKVEMGKSCKMVNYVKERGYSYACIKGEPVISTTHDTYGVWSPDSK